MSGHELYRQLLENRALLRKALEESAQRGLDYAQSQHDYRVALRKEMLRERMNGTPVTIISEICRGEDTVADLCRKRDVAKARYKSASEAINVYKLETRLLEEQIKREWSQAQ